MITYENENARLLIEEGGTNLVDTLLSQYIGTRHSLYITEKTALCLYNMYYKKEVEDNPFLMIGKKQCGLIPMLKMKMVQ